LVVVRDQPGIGKTALPLRRQMIVLRCNGVKAESDLVLAGVYGLVRLFLGQIGDPLQAIGGPGGGAGPGPLGQP
jgi:hypothetical protein